MLGHPGVGAVSGQLAGFMLTPTLSTVLAAGLRFFFAFIPLIMWLLGTLALLISTVVLIVALFFLDQVGVWALHLCPLKEDRTRL